MSINLALLEDGLAIAEGRVDSHEKSPATRAPGSEAVWLVGAELLTLAPGAS
ncbi:hypothetical protein KQ313_02760 [Synechococcus sp. CS-1325]|uniref:hypothetical protein n=1 Tax=Synechococcus sp. CS-1325 TaxID=2847979 RepID=UPI00223AF907|nr:hypothetical protein [Synechococcus sp. CS-1325]MCT0198605.1 hypothetical protein [Synechococcus sp. CS-1325]